MTPFPATPSGDPKDEGVKVTVPKDRFVAVTKPQQDKFFKVLQSEPRTFAALQKKSGKLTWFPDCLNTYLGVVSDRMEQLAPELEDSQFLGFVDWVMLQGHDTVQKLLDTTRLEDVPEFWQSPGHLNQAVGHWMQRC